MRAEGNIDVSTLETTLKNQRVFPEEYVVADCRKLDQLRKEVVAVHDPTDASQALLLQYFYQLKSLIPRLQALENEIKFNFHWHDAFVTGRKSSSSSLLFEMAAVLWNLGAFDSIRGAKVDRSSDEGIRVAGKYFQQASGYFDYLKEQILPAISQTSSLPCLSNDCLNMVKQLMLAQGQLCFYEKAVRDKKREAMKTGIVAKLAAQTSSFYTATSLACRTGTLGSILDISWFAITDFQAKCFHGAGEYWQALASKELALQKGSGYGEEITRYNRAEAYVRQAIETGRKHNILPALPAGAEALLNIIVANRANAQKDLTTIYMENVPNEGSVPEVIGVAMVKPSIIPEQSTVIPSLDILLFKFILPRQIVEQLNRFHGEVQQVVGNTTVIADNATNLGRTTLSSVGLPGALEGIKTENSVPASLWNKILKIQSMGGVERLKSLVMDLTNSSKRAQQSIRMIEEAIQQEESKDQAFFAQFPHYNGTRSIVLLADIKTNFQLLRDAFNNAQVNDETITRELIENTTEQKLLLLTKTREELLKLFPTAQSIADRQKATVTPPQEVNLLDFDDFTPTQPPAPAANSAESILGPDGVALEIKLHELAELFEQRMKQVERLKSFQSLNIQDAVQQTLLATSSSSSAPTAAGAPSNSSAAVQELIDRHLQEIHQLRQTIEQGVLQQQEALIQEILRLNDSFNRYKESNPVILEKNRFLTTVDENITRFFSLHSQVNAGQTFYNNLQAKLTTLQQNIDDVAFTQQWQRQEYEKDTIDEHHRLEQEQRDRELAMQLSNELNINNNNNNNNNPPPSNNNGGGAALYTNVAPQARPPVVAGGYNPTPSNPVVGSAGNYLGVTSAVPSVSAVPSGSGIVYGTPVNGPPAGFQQINTQNPPPAQAAIPVTTTASNQGAYNPYHQPQPASYAPQPAASLPSGGYSPALNYSNISYASTSAASNYNGTYNGYSQPAVPVNQPYNPAPTPYAAYPSNPAVSNPPPQNNYILQQPTLSQPAPQPAPLPPTTHQAPVASQQPPAAQRNLSSAEMEAKVSRVMEMGFPRDQVYSALSSCGWNEETAINVLLGVEAPPPQNQPPPLPPKPATSSSSNTHHKGGFFWGHKK